LQFAEYHAESPAGIGYSQILGEIFSSLPVMARFRERYQVRDYSIMEKMLEALLASYREWGGKANPPVIAIVDWREVPTWSEFEIIQTRFERMGVPTLVCDPRDLEFRSGGLWASGRRVDLVYRRVLINDIVARPNECRALVQAYESRAVCVANTLQCKIPHKKAYFGLLTDERNAALFSAAEREIIRRHIPWTRVLCDGPLAADVRRRRMNLVIKPSDEYGGAGVLLGWEANESEWDAAIERALKETEKTWIVQERINVRRESFPAFDGAAGVVTRDMLVDFSPYLFRGRLSGFLTRLSATGLANVTSGGGQVPAFVVRPL
jgi:uncharacterized circularly permuted ATP-grasp superfamily protein